MGGPETVAEQRILAMGRIDAAAPDRKVDSSPGPAAALVRLLLNAG